MPRNPSQRLDYTPSVSSLAKAALCEYRFISRTYQDVDRLARLRERLSAAESWAHRVIASQPSMLMVAATLQPRLLAGVFDELDRECSAAAPGRRDGEWKQHPSDFINAIRSRAQTGSGRSATAAAEIADHLIFALGMLGEFVGGNWRWVPSWTVDGVLPDGAGPWELEYSPPSDAVDEILRALRLVDDQGRTVGVASMDTEVTHERIRRLAASAIEDLRQKLQAPIAGVSMLDLSSALAAGSEHLMPVRATLASVVGEIEAATQPDAEAKGHWWAIAQGRLEKALVDWLEKVPKAIRINHNQRQQLKRDLSADFTYVSQYVLLLRANHASHELVRMLALLKKVCARLGRALDDMAGARQRVAQVSDAVLGHEQAFSRAIVEEREERRWRTGLGEDVGVAAAVITTVVGETGQTVGLQLRQIVEAVNKRARGRSSRYSQSRVEAVLCKMQELGLALRLPASALRPVGAAPRTGKRCRSHVGRVWWFNPLGAILAASER